jgi:hypothetical protein
MSGKEADEQAHHLGLAPRTSRCGNICIKGMLVLTAVAAMEANKYRNDDYARIEGRLRRRRLPLLDPGKAALESAGHF